MPKVFILRQVLSKMRTELQTGGSREGVRKQEERTKSP